jgi:hypothetical protein
MSGGLSARGGLATRLLNTGGELVERRLATGAQDTILPHIR